MNDSPSRRRLLHLLAAGSATGLAGCAGLTPPGGRPENPTENRNEDDTPTDTGPAPKKIDDWQYDGALTAQPTAGGGSSGGSGSKTVVGTSAPQATASASADLGFATGGAKSIATFRRNIDEGYLPLPESLSYEGLFYNYYFDTGQQGTCSSLFCPSYSTAVSADPLSEETERYVTVGLNAGLDANDFERKTLNLVVVLDISGSMGSSFRDYYYDRYGNKREVEGETDRQKIDVARDALVALTEQLRPEDRLGIVLFNDGSAVAKPLRTVEATDMDAIRSHIQEDIRAGGGTNLSAGIDDATDLLSEYADVDQTTYENRLICLTDAMPNLGNTDDEGLRATLAENAEQSLYSTFLGIGVDFNAELVDRLTAVRGANYYGVHSADEFERRLGEEFEYMVTPLVFDLSLSVDAAGYDIAQVYGSSAAEESTGEIMRVNTLFPSPKREGRTRGGVVLLQLDRQSAAGEMALTVDWETRTGERQSTTTTIQFPDGGPEQFDNTGIRKAVLLSRYADLLKTWMVYEREPEVVPAEDGISIPPTPLGEWEQQSEPLTLSPPFDGRIRAFREYYEQELTAIGDDELQQELETLEAILAAE